MSNLYQRLRHKLVIIPASKRKNRAKVEQLRKKGNATVMIVASSLSMWRQEDIYRELLKYPEFTPEIIILPFSKYSAEEQKAEEDRFKAYFDNKGIPYHTKEEFAAINADIIFYPQFYRNIYEKGCRGRDNEDKLLCYFPYGIQFIDEAWQYNSRFHNVAWKIFVQSDYVLGVAKRFALNKGANNVNVGEADADVMLSGTYDDPWKPQQTPKKRVIWAPHHSFGTANMLGRQGFLWAGEVMRKLAIEYKDTIQFAFKPHPRLLSELYIHPEWGKEKADDYFAFWQNSDNTQYEGGEFFNLFKSSDALIHDCNSFSAEYLYTEKPAAFVTKDVDAVKEHLNELGQSAIDAHYITGSEEEIRAFLDNVIAQGNDPKAEERTAFFHKYLKPLGNGSFAHKVAEDMKKSIWG